MDKNPENNIILTQTEGLTMNPRPAGPKYARNKNMLIIGGSGSGKTRFIIKPNLMQCRSKDYPVSFVVTDPKGSLIIETGKMLRRHGYRIKVLNTVNFDKSHHYNPLSYIRSEKDILKLVTCLIANTNADPQDKYWILRTLVVRRDHVVGSNTRSKMLLHSLLTQHYPNYRSFFKTIAGKTSLAFFKAYPSPSTLKEVTAEELAAFIREKSSDYYGKEKALEIIHSLEDTTAAFQEVRDETVRSTIRQIEFNLEEISRLECEMAKYLESFNCTLLTMTGIDVVTACQLMSCIGDVKRFPTAAKLARYAGIAPVTYASGQKGFQFANQRGNRELNSLFYNLAVRVSTPCGPHEKVINGFFYDYYHRKQAEGKTKRQALKCVQRRLVNIVWTMLTNGEEYVNPPVLDKPKEELQQAN